MCRRPATVNERTGLHPVLHHCITTLPRTLLRRPTTVFNLVRSPSRITIVFNVSSSRSFEVSSLGSSGRRDERMKTGEGGVVVVSQGTIVAKHRAIVQGNRESPKTRRRQCDIGAAAQPQAMSRGHVIGHVLAVKFPRLDRTDEARTPPVQHAAHGRETCTMPQREYPCP